MTYAEPSSLAEILDRSRPTGAEPDWAAPSPYRAAGEHGLRAARREARNECAEHVIEDFGCGLLTPRYRYYRWNGPVERRFAYATQDAGADYAQGPMWLSWVETWNKNEATLTRDQIRVHRLRREAKCRAEALSEGWYLRGSV